MKVLVLLELTHVLKGYKKLPTSGVNGVTMNLGVVLDKHAHPSWHHKGLIFRAVCFSSSSRAEQVEEAMDGFLLLPGLFTDQLDAGESMFVAQYETLKLMESPSSSTFQFTLFLSHWQDPTLISSISTPTFGLGPFHAPLFCPFHVGTK